MKFKQNVQSILDALLSVSLLILVPASSHAASVKSILDKTATWLQGDIAKGIGLIALIGCGYMCIFMQRLPKSQFMMVLLGLGVIFGSSSLYSTLIG